MNPAAVIAAIESVLAIVNALEKGVVLLTPFAQAIYDNLVNKTEITQAQLDALEAAVDAAAAEIQTPLPEDLDGSTET